MRKILLVTLMLVSAVLAVSCGEKADQTVADDGTFIYAAFADAEKAAADGDKYMVLDFYTDW